jgi:hypothetical protein
MGSLYTDFDLSMNLTPNGDVAPLNDEGCIRQVINNSTLLNSFDIPFDSSYAANIKNYLFENPNKITESEIIKSISNVLLKDPRLQDPSITITYSSDYQFCYITIVVFVVLMNKTITETISVERTR